MKKLKTTMPLKAKSGIRPMKPMGMKKIAPLKTKTVAFNPKATKTTMMRKVRKSGVQPLKKASMVRQIRKNRI